MLILQKGGSVLLRQVAVLRTETEMDIEFSFIALSSFNKTPVKPSPVNDEILLIRFIPQKEAMIIEINTWFTPNLVALCHRLGNRVLTDFMMPCLFMYFATVFKTEYFAILFPVNECFTTFDWPFNFFFVYFILKVMFFAEISAYNDLKINN
ncbi:MAG: hypothetical protein ACOCXH_01605 [Cyclobacteriaceae bacterium]